MSTYQIEVDGQEYTVEIDDPNTSPVQVVVNGKPFVVTITRRHGPQPTQRQTTRGVGRNASAHRNASGQQTKPMAADVDLLLETYVPTVVSTYVASTLEPEPGVTQGQAGEAGPTPVVPDRLRRREGASPERGLGPDGEGTETVTAPMPGTILDIAVAVGDVVQPGDILCNLEAMKMKSPIRSPGAGRLVDVLIVEGQNVGYGDVLFTLGQAPSAG